MGESRALQVGAVTGKVAGQVALLGLPWQGSCLLLALTYFYAHYLFASNLSHVSAMCQAFLSVAIAAGGSLSAVFTWYPPFSPPGKV